MNTWSAICLFASFLLARLVDGRIHTLPLKNDERSVIVMTSFGYLKGGSLEVNVTGLKITGKGLKDETKIGFSLDKSSSSDTSSYVEKEESTRGCVLDQETDKDMFENVPRAIMKIIKEEKGTYILKVYERGLNGLKFYESKHAYEAQKKSDQTDEGDKGAVDGETKDNGPADEKDATDGETDPDAPDATKAEGPVENREGKSTGKGDGAVAETDSEAADAKAGGPVENREGKSTGKEDGAVAETDSEAADATKAGGPVENREGKSTGKEDKKEPGAKPDGKEDVDKSPGDVANGDSGKTRKRRASVPNGVEIASKTGSDKQYVEQPSLAISGDLKSGMNLSFYVRIENDDQTGLYELYFHNCENLAPYGSTKKKVVTADFTAHIVEMNGDSYLSAGDMALPIMYGVISAMFFFVSLVWLQVLCGTKEAVFKIHYLMAVIVFVKGLSVMFHSLDYYFIAKDGRTEAWAVIYYIIHLLKGVLLIICLLLIGTGWAFIKYILSNRDKKLFMIVIPMQVMVNVAYVIMEETEQGNRAHFTWKDIAILVDVLCCGAILIPVVWSIRHLQEASQTDGKAAINLCKLELFRQFYIMVVCYLYFTRIIVYLLEITLPFQYIWVHALFAELGAFVFFSVTGYKFRPGCDNPYLKLEQYDEDDPEEALTQSGATESLSRVNQREKDLHDTDEFDVLLPKQRTSHV